MSTGLFPRPGVARRQALGLLATTPAAAAAQPDAARAAWAAFQARYVAPEGRVVDTGNGGVSHSEGQGWSMLLAVRADDRRGFDRLYDWTRRTLQRPRDALHAWRYRPDAATPVDDPNNATDGDICIAWALLEAGQRWGSAEHAAAGAAIGRDVLRLLVRPAGTYGVLLPGVQGFERPDHLVVNLSYYVFPALRRLAQAVPDAAWARLAADGLTLLRRASFGRWQLPPDWLQVARRDGALAPATGWPARFSFDAVRVPLWLCWAGLRQEPALVRANRFWAASAPPPPAWVDLQTDSPAPYPASPGVAALVRLAASDGKTGPLHPHPREIVDSVDYYSTVLILLSAWALEEAKGSIG
ncbi:glycosyl hydrolase family 8 [Dankookia sp. GCM10030260]|uniref:glycosyl hydrolase family 8 n=1 Tax=Dankookia sp. GCM10030260 TaxID=3273390 RepID=UPI003607A38F